MAGKPSACSHTFLKKERRNISFHYASYIAWVRKYNI